MAFCSHRFVLSRFAWAGLRLLQVRDRLKKMGHLQPLNIFLRQEIDRMQRVVTDVRSTLNDLKLAIDGTIIMSENLRDALDSMYDARIPATWKRVSVVYLGLLYKLLPLTQYNVRVMRSQTIFLKMAVRGLPSATRCCPQKLICSTDHTLGSIRPKVSHLSWILVQLFLWNLTPNIWINCR